jgi:hypothetical protein
MGDLILKERKKAYFNETRNRFEAELSFINTNEIATRKLLFHFSHKKHLVKSYITGVGDGVPADLNTIVRFDNDETFKAIDRYAEGVIKIFGEHGLLEDLTKDSNAIREPNEPTLHTDFMPNKVWKLAGQDLPAWQEEVKTKTFGEVHIFPVKLLGDQSTDIHVLSKEDFLAFRELLDFSFSKNLEDFKTIPASLKGKLSPEEVETNKKRSKLRTERAQLFSKADRAYDRLKNQAFLYGLFTKQELLTIMQAIAEFRQIMSV